MTTSNQRSLKLITLGAFFCLFLLGFTDNIKGAAIPALLRDLQLNYSQGGAILFGAYAGVLIADLFAGVLSDRYGSRFVILSSCLFMLVGITGYSTTHIYPLFILFFGMVGIGLGGLLVAGNRIVADTRTNDKGRYLNLLNFFYGVAATLAPIYAGQMLIRGFTWRQIYQFTLPMIALLAIGFMIIPFPAAARITQSSLNWKELRQTALRPPMGWFYLLLASYVSSEMGVGAWAAEFLQKTKGQSVALSATYLSLFFGSIMVGRLIGSFLVQKTGYVRSMQIAAGCGLLSLVIGIFAPPALAFFLPLTGLFYSIIFPTATAAVADLNPGSGSILGLFFSFAGLGGIIGSWSVGVLSDWLGIQWGFSILIVYAASTFFALTQLRRKFPVAEGASETRK